MGNKVLVTGATGRIGSLLCKKLYEKGYDIKAFTLPGDPFVSRLEGVPCEIVYGNLLNKESIEDALSGCDKVLHMAAYMNPASDMDEDLYMDINVKGTWNITRAAMRAGIKRFVYGSSDAIYPPHTTIQNPIMEDDPKRPFFLYPLTKNLNEMIVFEAWRESQYKMEVTATRFGSVYMKDEVLNGFTAKGIRGVLHGLALNKATTIYKEGITEPWKYMPDDIPDDMLCIPYGPDGRAWRMHNTHVEDVVQGIILALESDKAPGESFNILGPTATAKDVAVKYIAEKTGREYREVHLQNFWEFECSIEKARRVLGYNPVWDTKRMIDDALIWRANGSVSTHGLNSAMFKGDH